MSNDQTTKNLLTPIILKVGVNIDQTQTALAFIKDQLGWELKPNSPQLQLINSELTTIPIEIIRNLISELAYAAHLGKSRAFVFLAADQLSIAAQHAFLKSLEEPPADTLILLVSTNPDQLLSTIRSRCLTHQHQSANQDINVENLPLILKELLETPSSIKYHQLIDFTTKYKDRELATQLLQQFLFYIKQSIPSSMAMINIQKQLLITLNQLQANANVKLALEGCFFTIKNTLCK